MKLFAPRLVVSSHAFFASGTHRAITFTPSPCLRMCSLIGLSGVIGVVSTRRILSCTST
jgi:hypothetical protein